MAQEEGGGRLAVDVREDHVAGDPEGGGDVAAGPEGGGDVAAVQIVVQADQQWP